VTQRLFGSSFGSLHKMYITFYPPYLFIVFVPFAGAYVYIDDIHF